MTSNVPSKTPSKENSEQDENSQLERKIQKWKSLYRNEKQPEENNSVKNSGHLPGLKEAHKQLSLENYKLKKAYSDIQKQLDLMKVMSWYRRAQVDKLRQSDQLNMSHVVGMLKKELQYLEAVYFREKRLADMWRNEEKEKEESSPNTWKYFKDRWNKKYKGDESAKEGVCVDRQDCEGETRTAEDVSGPNSKETVDHSGTLAGGNEALENRQSGLKNVVLEERKQGKESKVSTNTESSDYVGSQDNVNTVRSSNPLQERENVANEKTGTKGDFETVDDTKLDEIRRQHEEMADEMEYRNFRNEKDSLFWRHLRLAKTVEDDDLKRYSDNEDQIRLSSEEIASGDNTANDQNELSAEGSSNGSGNGQPNDQNNKESDTTPNESTHTGFLAQVEPDWFSYEVLEQDEEVIIAYENKDSVPHVLYGFLHGEFREIESGPGDIFVMSVKTECFKVNSSFIVSLSNNFPKPIQFFALLPNGKIKHQKIAEQVKMVIAQLSSNDGEESRPQPLIYEATVMENGKLEVSEQNDGESGEQNGENQDEGSKTEVESGDGEVEVSKQNHDESVENAEYRDEASKTFGEDEVSEHNDGEFGDESGQYREVDSKNDDQSGNENKVENNEHQHSEETQGYLEETPQPNQEVPLSDLQPGESYVFDQYTGRIYRHTVSAHQHPISDYETLLAEIHRKVEKVYCRFPRNMIIEKFIVKDEVVKTTDDGSISIGEDDEGPVEDTVGNLEPVEYEEDVSNIVQELLKNPWRDGHKTPILMTYDSAIGTITSIYVTLSKVQPDDVISHDVLKNGKIETFGENIKITSYLLHGNELLQIVREDEVKHGFTKIAEEETGGEVDGSSETEDENSRNYENADENSSNSENEDENSSNSENEDENSSNFENEDMLETNVDDNSHEHSSQATSLENSQQESQNEECLLRLGESDTTEYWAYTAQRGATFIRETVERLMPSRKYKEEDFAILSISTNDIDESVSYTYCDDGSVQKTWRRIEKVPRNRASEESGKSTESDVGDEKSGVDDSEGLQEDWTDDDDYEYDDEEYRDDIDDDHDYDYEHDIHDDIDDDIGDNVNDDDRDTDDEDHEEYDDTDIENQNENDYDASDPHYDALDHEDIDDDIRDNNNIDAVDDKSNPEPESETNEESNNSNAHENSNDPESIYDNEKIKELDKENYDMFISREWQNLKLRQQQFEHSKKQNMRLQQQMLAEWNKMKQQYREFQKNFQKNQKSELDDSEIEGIWTDLKHQQKQFDSMKKQIEEELKKSLQKEWEKLKNKQAEIEMREKQLYEDEESNVQYQEIVGYQRVTVDKREDINEQQGTAWGSNNDDTLISELQPETTLEKQNEYDSEIEATYQVSYDDSEIGDEMELIHEDPTPEIQDSTDEIVHAPWQVVEGHYVDRIQSDAWEMSDSDVAYTQNMHMEENLPHELPYIPETDENLDYHVDTTLSEAWELSQTSNTGEEQYMIDENLPREISYVPSTGSSEIPGMTDSIFRIHEMQEMYQKETFPEEIPHIPSPQSSEPPLAYDSMFQIHARQQEENFPGEVSHSPLTDSSEMSSVSEGIFNIVATQNMQQEDVFPEVVPYTSPTETTTQKDNIIPNEYNEHTVDTSDSGLNFETEDTQSSSQWELQIQKLREELDRLYEAKKSERNGLQVVKHETESPVTPIEDLNTKSESVAQPKCPPKCPNTASYSECSPKCPKRDSTEDVSSVKPQSFGKRSDEKTKQSSFAKKSDPETSEIEKNEKERKSPAFMDYIEGHSYLRQLEPQEYDRKMPGLNNGPLDPRKRAMKIKKTKIKSIDENDDKNKSIEKTRKRRKQDNYLEKNAQEAGLNKPFKKGKKQKIKHHYPLNPHREKKSARKDQKSIRKEQ